MKHSFLVNIESLQESNFVKSLAPKHQIWIGFSDVHKEGYWVWTKDGYYTPFTNWDSYQPDNRGGSEDCAVVLGSFRSSRWGDQQCTLAKYSVCEKGERIFENPSKPTA